ncbi:MAG: pantoate--beta-alanine ligase [Bacteroidales bacterium]|nr:pantoate--beta-alanine ligase [Bacteroidales bacterium]
MKIIYKQNILAQTADELRKKSLQTGFVPTMGALHAGHLQLLKQAKAENDVVICSIFVNPIQFNNAADLERYPNSPEQDIALLNDVCDILFMPSVEEMYPVLPTEHYDFGTLETVMEGYYRPGHFKGVAIIVKRFLDLIQPDRAYFGEKDFQQLVIIRQLVQDYHYKTIIRAVSTVREDDGLAMSSRNRLLSPQARAVAPFIRRTLSEAKTLKEKKKPYEIAQWIQQQFDNNKSFTLEYASVVNAKTLEEITEYSQAESIVACVAVWLDNVRLIDNITIV